MNLFGRLRGRDGSARRLRALNQLAISICRGARWIVALLAMACLARCAAAQGTPRPSSAGLLAAFEDALGEVIAANEPSVVSVARVRREGAGDAFAPDGGSDAFGRAPLPEDPNFIPNEFGTGVVIDGSGLILTCCHVVREDCEHWVTTVDRKVYRASIVAADPRSDLAVLRIDATGLRPIRFGDGTRVRKGQFVIALGNPYAIARDGQASASLGIVSNLGRKAAPLPESEGGSPSLLHQFGTLIQTDVKLDLGTSGGPLLNLEGEMIGLTTSLAALSGFEEHAGYAVPVDDVFRRAVEAMKPGGEVQYGLLGVSPGNLSDRDRIAGMSGVLINAVSEGTPAAKAGLQLADLITHVDGREVDNADELMLQLGRRDVGEALTLSVVRDGRPVQVPVTLAKYFVRGKKIVTAPPRVWRGVEVDYPNAVHGDEVYVEYGSILHDGCIVVTRVAEGSSAWDAGLRRGDFIARVDGTPVATPDEFFAAVENHRSAVTMTLGQLLPDHPERVVEPEAE